MTTDHPFQIPLSVGLRDDARFENFYAQGNELLCASLKATAHSEGEQFIYIWGNEGVGCTHLLQAVCHEADPAGRTAAYLPLDELKHLGGGILEGMEFLDLVCLDSVDVVVGDTQWEEALFHFFNRIREQGNTLIIAAGAAPRYLGVKLPDLASRLSWGIVFQVQALDDDTKIKAIQMRATARGLEFSDDVARYLLHHASRNMNDLALLLDTLDQASLSAKRKVTIPFIKEVTGL
ncbi:DnaA regulatory inactivator Hda [Neptuniibacter pectenicola]|jgi:DnaA family protein|uniref:DnaA regulatory inactivator Hda n=1 Tax=Neptuniibacter pectenicola TaxID=1806669 RepID=A0ABU9TUT0_9GAMM|nr:DnaA regulatory inactivator Hda [Neptuniibacter pectenicola]KXJ52784.1 MAG: DnaA regulatory inactivator Hda [Neptuniibacter sp. Phe_28]|tara:strand:+ start:143 stop:847 length:705 start_codon:yes stop_codon:yes gene_type:complete